MVTLYHKVKLTGTVKVPIFSENMVRSFCSVKQSVGSENAVAHQESIDTEPASRGIANLLRIGRAAVASVLVCSPMFLRARPKTPLRVFCIVAFEYLARVGGGTLGTRRRVAIAHACDFGSLCDKYYDEQKLDLAEYRSLRSGLRRLAPEAGTFRYIQRLRKAERGRPILSASTPGVADASIGYRASVIELSLRWMQDISGLTEERVHFHSLGSLVCLMQLADDLLDWKEDQARNCPSYVTAFLLEQPGTGIARPLRAQADVMLQRTVGAARKDASAIPFALAGLATWMFVVVLLKLRFPK